MADPIIAADYRETAITGKTWRRANRVVITNPYQGPAAIAIDEEEITQVGDLLSSKPTDLLHMAVDLTGGLPVYDPTTGQLTGQTMSQLQVYIALYSVYRMLAAARDAAQAAQAAQAQDAQP